MRCAIILAIFALVSTAQGATIHVPADQPTIQDGIDAAVNGDTVLVAPGTYVENIDFKGKAITVKSKLGPKVTVIDGGNPLDPDYGSCVLFVNGEGVDSVLDGFTLTNGTGTLRIYSYTDYFGGGILCDGSSPTITNNIITGNILKENDPNGNPRGAGIFCNAGGLTQISNNIITFNKTYGHSGDGGGLCFTPTNPQILSNNVIAFNHAKGTGGGIRSYCDLLIVNCVIYGNTANNTAWSAGARLHANTTIVNTVIWNHSCPK